MTVRSPIAISSGHAKNVRGACGNPVPPEMDEVDEVRKIVNRVAEILDNEGITVHVFHDNTSTSSSQNLSTINAWHNSQNRVLDVSVHLNATEGAYGTEVLYVTQEALAREVSAAIAKAGGFKDRGPKYRSDLSFLNGTNKPAILLECWFCDSADDCNKARAHWEAICEAIASSIAGKTLDGEAPPPETDDEHPLPPKFPQDVIDHICQLASSSLIAGYSWKDRGRAPPGYINGMAMAYAQAVVRFNDGDPVMLEMAKANTGDDSVDVLSWYASSFTALGMSNAVAGLDTVRHLYAFMVGLGMRETSGKHCCGRDQSASNTDSDTCEAGLMQTSYNAHVCSPHFDTLCDQYDKSSVQGYMSVFAQGVSCSSSDWACYGSGAGYKFQETAKWSPCFAVETCAITLRNLRAHYGPVNRREVELCKEADDMLRQIEDYVRSLSEPPPAVIDDELEALLDTRPEEACRDPHVQWLVDSMDFLLRKQT
jgi:hypothetical protein